MLRNVERFPILEIFQENEDCGAAPLVLTNKNIRNVAQKWFNIDMY